MPVRAPMDTRAPALDDDESGLGVSLSPAAAPGQEEEIEPGVMLALALPLLLASALFGALRGRVAPARKPDRKPDRRPDRNATVRPLVRMPEHDTAPAPAAVKTAMPSEG